MQDAILAIRELFPLCEIDILKGNPDPEFIMNMVIDLEDSIREHIEDGGIYSYVEFESRDYPDDPEPRCFDIWIPREASE